MYDTIGDDAGHIPANAQKAAGYVTGTPDILWPAPAWARLANAGKVRVDQSAAGDLYAAGKADVYDMETDAGTPARYATIAAGRHDRGLPNCGYGGRNTLSQLTAVLDAVTDLEKDWWHGTSCWLADPMLSLAEASKLIGTTMFGGLVVVAVQWATPSSNPTTVVGTGTLKSLNLDLSVARSDWFPGKPAPEAWQMQALNAARSAEASAALAVKILEDNL
jgi:hypothetical protein